MIEQEGQIALSNGAGAEVLVFNLALEFQNHNDQT